VVSSSESSDDEDDEVKEMRKAAKEAEAKRREEEAAKAAKEAEEQGDPEANLGAAAKQRLANARMLRKLSAEVRESQEKLRQLVTAAPQLLPGVSVNQKEELFEQLAELLAAAEQPISKRWFERQQRGADGAGAAATTDADVDVEVAAWASFVCVQLEFVFHASDASSLPVPSSLGARILRQAVLVDAELTGSMLRTQLVQRVMLFAPGASAAAGFRAQHPRMGELGERLEKAVGMLCKQAV